jgi:predicted nucleic acid-binding protein
MKEAVLDNSVISAYVKIGRLSLLRVVLKDARVYVADTVYREMVFPEALRAVSCGPKSGGWMILEKVDVTGFGGPGIGAGEAGTVKLAKEKNAIAVLDDLSGRKFAARQGVAVVGTLALLRLASDRRLVSGEELVVILRDLEEKDSFRMSRDLRDWVLGK